MEGKRNILFLGFFGGFGGRTSSSPALRFLPGFLRVAERVTQVVLGLGRSDGSTLAVAGWGLVERATLVVALPPRGLPRPAIT